MSASGTDWASVVKDVIASDPRTLVIVLLAALLVFLLWLFTKFIRVKFIDQTTKVVNAAASVETAAAASVTNHETMIKDFELKLKAYSDQANHASGQTLLELNNFRGEMRDIRKALGTLAIQNRSTAEAVARYQERMDLMEKNFDVIMTTIRRNQKGSPV